MRECGYKGLYVTDAQGFYNHLKKQTQLQEIKPLDACQREVVNRFCNRKAPWSVWGKIRAVKSFVKEMIKTGLIPQVKVKIRLGGKGIASMLDEGKIVFYRRFLISQPYHENVLAVLHEVAHIVLWASDEYQALKKCDLEFINGYVKDVGQTVITPIEYYANVISISWLKSVISEDQNPQRAKLLIEQIERLEEKLNIAKEKI